MLVPIDSLAAQALKLRHAVFQMRRCPCCLVEHAEKATVCRVVLSGWDELGLIRPLLEVRLEVERPREQARRALVWVEEREL